MLRTASYDILNDRNFKASAGQAGASAIVSKCFESFASDEERNKQCCHAIDPPCTKEELRHERDTIVAER